jgi:hypothetical protein
MATSNGQHDRTASSGAGVAVLDAPPSDDPVSNLKAKLLAGDYINEGRTQADQLAQLAVLALKAMPTSPALLEMVALSRAVVERDH